MFDKMLFRKIKIEQHEVHLKQKVVNYLIFGVPDRYLLENQM
jgi:hypothetical protein